MYITSLLVAMERSLSSPPKNGWEKVNQNQVFELLHTVFCTLTAALRYEPANSHFFKRWPPAAAGDGHQPSLSGMSPAARPGLDGEEQPVQRRG